MPYLARSEADAFSDTTCDAFSGLSAESTPLTPASRTTRSRPSSVSALQTRRSLEYTTETGFFGLFPPGMETSLRTSAGSILSISRERRSSSLRPPSSRWAETDIGARLVDTDTFSPSADRSDGVRARIRPKSAEANSASAVAATGESSLHAPSRTSYR